MKKNPAFNSFAIRTVSGAVIAAVVAGAVLLSPYSFLALLLAICIGGTWEFYKIASKAGALPQAPLGMVTGVLIILLFGAGFIPSNVGVTAFDSVTVLFFVVFICELYRRKENPLVNIAATLTGILYVAFPLLLLGLLGTEGWSSMRWGIIGFIVIVWANDVGAYLVGVAFGRTRLFERISPKKSWEGFFGGLALAVAVGITIGWLLEGGGGFLGKHTVFWAGLSMVVVVSGVFGDLVESMLKRLVLIKDSGGVIPGHGGFLDRFDTLLFSVPFVYLYFVIFAS